MDLESVAEELYAGSPDDFVERRSQRVAEARAARERPLAKAISSLRRPTRSAWMVNLLSRQAGDDVRALLELGAALANAQQRAAGDDLRRLSAQRHATLSILTHRAAELAAVARHAATEASRQEVTSTLQAALADPAVADLVRSGRVTQPVTYAGFGPLAGGDAAPAPEVIRAAEPEPDSEPEREPDPARQQAEERAEEAVAAAAEALAVAEEEAAQATNDADDATRHADGCSDAVEALRAQLQQAEEQERQALDVARAARARAREQQRLVGEAREALTEAEKARPSIGGSPT